jgi:putative ABC transport system permease protein
METLFKDVSYAFTMMRRNKGFTAAALLTLALGIGATTAVFSVVYGVLLRPLPYPAADRLVRLSEEHPGGVSPLRAPMLSNLTYHAWIASPQTVEAFAAYSTQQITIALPDGPARLAGAAVTPTLFSLVGATPALGRLFQPDEGAPGADGFLVLSDRGWRERFSADPSVVGRGVIVDGRPFVIVGVARPGFAFPDRNTLLWTPMAVRRPSPDTVAGKRGQMNVLSAIARLRPGVTPEQAAAEGTAAARTTIRPMAANILFGIGGPPVVHVRGMVDEMTATIRPALFVLAAGVACVLLIACANVANLFLARGVARERELAVRAAIGASAARIARQLVTESLVLSATGGAAGLALAWALVRLAQVTAARDVPRLDAVRLDAPVLAFTAATALFTALAAGIAPALRGSRFDLAESLRGGDGATAGGFRGRHARRMRDGLLTAEAAFAVLLLVGATLLARSFVRLTHVDAGYTADRVLAAEVYVPGYDTAQVGTPGGVAKAEHIGTLIATVLARVRATSTVTSAGAGNMMPLDGATQIAGFPAPWTAPGAAPATARSLTYQVTPGYAEALGLRLRRGRLFTDADQAAGTRAWIVNEEFARLYLPPDPLGYRFEQKLDTGAVPNEIVGIVANVLKDGNDRKPQPEVYVIPRDSGRFSGRFEIVVRAWDNAAALAPGVRALLRELEPSAAVETVTLSQRVAASVDQPRFATTVLATFAMLALALASVGLYGVLSYSVSQRRRELGVRAALGAGKSDLVRLVIREGLGAATVGLAIGLVAAAALTRLMQGVLFGVAPLDAVSFAAAPLVLAIVAVLACLLPARRAASTDPAEALRCE